MGALVPELEPVPVLVPIPAPMPKPRPIPRPVPTTPPAPARSKEIPQEDGSFWAPWPAFFAVWFVILFFGLMMSVLACRNQEWLRLQFLGCGAEGAVHKAKRATASQRAKVADVS